MSINENNYEEYFLLYADKELSLAEKNMVEDFVVQHPGLEEEFLMLQQSVMTPDNIKLDNKKILLKEEGFITKNNYEEKFILYNDNELTSLQKEDAKKFIKQNSSLQTELALFQQIKYQPDASVIFPNKKSLLRKERDVKVIPLNWLKALVAAVLLGLGLWIGIGYLQKNNPEKVFVKITPSNNPSKIIDSAKEKKEADDNSLSEKKAIVQPLIAVNSIAKPLVKLQSSHKENLAVNNSNKSDKKDNQKVSDTAPQDKNILASIDPPKKIDPVIKTNPAESPVDISTAKIEDIQNPSQANNLASKASYKINQVQKSDNYVFYNITEEQFNKSKVGVLFKKLKGVLDKKTLKEKIFKPGSKEDNPIN